MLRTNLSTRPFYNERLVQLALGASALLVLALTAFNVVQFRSLSDRHAQLLGRVGDAERQATTLRADAERARHSVDRAQLERVAAAAREANLLIDQRTFSWTDLLNRLEATLPDDVRIQSIRPATDKDGNLTVSMVVVGRRAEDIQQFIDQLGGTGAFRHLISRTESTNQQGLLEVILEGWYLPAGTTAASPRAVPAPAAAAPAPARPVQAPAAKPRPARED
jgi:Tfp pilus assembly protein PilN